MAIAAGKNNLKKPSKKIETARAEEKAWQKTEAKERQKAATKERLQLDKAQKNAFVKKETRR